MNDPKRNTEVRYDLYVRVRCWISTLRVYSLLGTYVSDMTLHRSHLITIIDLIERPEL